MIDIVRPIDQVILQIDETGELTWFLEQFTEPELKKISATYKIRRWWPEGCPHLYVQDYQKLDDSKIWHESIVFYSRSSIYYVNLPYLNESTTRVIKSSCTQVSVETAIKFIRAKIQ